MHSNGERGGARPRDRRRPERHPLCSPRLRPLPQQDGVRRGDGGADLDAAAPRHDRRHPAHGQHQRARHLLGHTDREPQLGGDLEQLGGCCSGGPHGRQGPGQGGVLQDHLRLQADAGLLQRDLQVSLLIPCARSSARRLLQLPRGVVGAGRRWLFAHATEDSGGGWGEAGRREGWGILAGQAMLGCAAGSLLSFSSFPAESSLSESKSQARLT
mmetsp:Transcript_2054/g.4688  ORF Transcript_2054/g.4688 Transcript_2054/m.4688 type:complete len:214 (+) Transcript_2054:465-1106(+)